MRAADACALATTDRAVAEATRRIELGMMRPEFLGPLNMLSRAMMVIPTNTLASLMPAAELALLEAMPSRNGSIRDAHILALAWEADADIWTHDRDFVGTGVASWSTPNLMRALAAE